VKDTSSSTSAHDFHNFLIGVCVCVCVCACTNICCFWRLFCSYSIWSKMHTAYFPTAQVYNPTYLLVLWLSFCFISLKNLFPKVSHCCIYKSISHTMQVGRFETLTAAW